MHELLEKIINDDSFREMILSDSVSSRCYDAAFVAHSENLDDTARELLLIGVRTVRTDCCRDGYEGYCLEELKKEYITTLSKI